MLPQVQKILQALRVVCKCMGQCTLEGSVQGGFQCTLPCTFTYRAWPYSVHCPFSLNNLPR